MIIADAQKQQHIMFLNINIFITLALIVNIANAGENASNACSFIKNEKKLLCI